MCLMFLPYGKRGWRKVASEWLTGISQQIKAKLEPKNHRRIITADQKADLQSYYIYRCLPCRWILIFNFLLKEHIGPIVYSQLHFPMHNKFN